PFTLELNVLYSNKDLLYKYGRDIPNTWDELLETSKYIMSEELKLNNNTDIISYNGLFCEGDYGILSIYEFINSYRDSNNDLYPDIKSNCSSDALIMMKKIKEEIGSDSQFLMEDIDTRNRIISGNALFLKFWYYEHNPEKKKGITGTIAGGTNIAINKYSDKIKQDAAIQFLEFIVSLYDDEEVCSKINCDVIKNAQPLSVLDFNVKLDNVGVYIKKKEFDEEEYIKRNKLFNEFVSSNVNGESSSYSSQITKNTKNTKNTNNSKKIEKSKKFINYHYKTSKNNSL
ncbi:hypothetical protein PIROE2DRAFT_12829, partial [Piromyces sp. E2]